VNLDLQIQYLQDSDSAVNRIFTTYIGM